MIFISKTLRELSDEIIGLMINCNANLYPTKYQTYDEAWDNLYQSFAFLRSKLGEARYAQLVEMATQAKAHYDAEAKDEHQGFLSSWLMQDIEQVVKGKPPYAYPEELYRWPR